MTARWRCWIGLWLALCCLPLAAQPGQITVGNEESYLLSRAFTYLEDRSAKLTLQDIVQPAQQALFRPVSQTGPGANFGLTRSAIWLQIRIAASAEAPANWLLELAYSPLDRLELYSPGPGAGHQRQLAGDLQPFDSRIVPHRNHVLPVQLVPGGQTTLYLRLESQGTVAAPVRLWQPAALWRGDQTSYSLLSLYFGLLVGLLLYNLLLWSSVRDRAYLIYVAFAAAMGIAQAALTGLGAQFLWPGWVWWNSVSVPVGMSTAAVFGLLFTRNFLSSRVRLVRLDRLLLVQLAGWLAALAAALVLPYFVASWMVTVLAMVSVATMVVLGVISVRQGYAGARPFFGAWALLLGGVATLTLHNIGLLPSNLLTANALLIGSALEMVLLSFALADRINVARRFKEQARLRITAEHAMVEALRESREQLQTVLNEREIILENSIVGIVFLSASGRLRWANQAMREIFGAGSQPITSMERYYLSREHYRQVGAQVGASAARGEVFQTELQVQQHDGARIWISLSGKAVSPRDLSQGTVWVIMNITERKELEERLQKSMSEREAILNSALVGIVLSVARRHEWVNQKFAQMLGYPRQVLIGQPSSYIHPNEQEWERFEEQARMALEAAGSYVCERQLKHRSGELFWVEMGGSCLRPNDPDSGVIWTFLDITARRQSESEVREALEQQQALNQLRTRFVAMTSHEFRTPLAAILTAEELLRHYGDRLPQAERIEVLDSISSGVQRMSRMIDRVLLLGQADAQLLGFEPKLLDLKPLCQQFVDEARAQQPDCRCEVLTEFGDGVGEGVYDEKLLRHIFSNLLSNALKYSPGGGQVRFGISREGPDTVFEVADRGIGIPTEEISHLFESFHRASNVGAIQGTGLGLAIVKNAVQVHGGSIAVTSRDGQGTSFTVRLPAADPARPS